MLVSGEVVIFLDRKSSKKQNGSPIHPFVGYFLAGRERDVGGWNFWLKTNRILSKGPGW